jgi:hypothetical protein
MKIGNKEFKYKKNALEYYRNILNSYKFGQILNENDFEDILDLLDYSFSFYNSDNSIIEENFTEEELESEENIEIKEIRIAKVQFNTKCFEIVYANQETEIFSYRILINRPKINLNTSFSIACRNVIQNDLILVIQKYFSDNSEKGFVKCQETNEMAKWEDLAVDHRQPNTFSIIVDRFKEVKNINVEEIEYYVDENNFFLFKDEKLTIEFQEYHKGKANLRVVKKECNLSRTGMARINRTSKDLKII